MLLLQEPSLWLIWFGWVWFGVVWFGVVWCGVVWFARHSFESLWLLLLLWHSRALSFRSRCRTCLVAFLDVASMASVPLEAYALLWFVHVMATHHLRSYVLSITGGPTATHILVNSLKDAC